MARTARIFGSAPAICSTPLADSLRPDGGVSEAGTGIGASELVDRPDEPAVLAVALGAADASGGGCGVAESVSVAARAAAGSAQKTAQAMTIDRLRIMRGYVTAVI